MSKPLPGSSAGKMHSIEGARGIAALLIVLMHSGQLMRVDAFSGHVGLGGLFDFGYVGVDFFFVLSGFIITYVHFSDIGKPVRLGSYLWRRLSRIYPVYWIALLIYIAVVAGGRAFLGKPLDLGLDWTDLPGTLLLVRTEDPKYVEVAWSLQYEVMFYLSFASLLLHRGLGVLVAAVWASAILGGLAMHGWHVKSDGLFSAYSLQFILGGLVGWSARRPLRWHARPGMLGLAIIGFIAATWAEMHQPAPYSDLGRILLGLASAALLWVLCSLERQQRIHTPALLTRLGSVSYSVYLIHILFINLAFSVLARLGWYHAWPEWLVFLCGLTGGLGAGLLLGLLIELPLVARLKDHFSVAPAGSAGSLH